MGSPGFAVPSLLALAREEELSIACVVTQPDKPAGRGRKLMAPAVKLAATELGLSVLQPTKLKSEETLTALAALRPDLIVVAAYGRILPPALLLLPTFGCINVHASLLPRHRGASPIAQAILDGDHETGVSIMQMDEGLDTGPVYATRALAIAADDTTGSLATRLAKLGAELLLATLPIVFARRAPAPQPREGATYAPLLQKSAGELDFGGDTVALARRVRAMDPWPRAFFRALGKRVQVLEAHVGEGRGAPGEVLAVGAAGVEVACGEGSLFLDEVRPEGKPRMSAAAWASGRMVSIDQALSQRRLC